MERNNSPTFNPIGQDDSGFQIVPNNQNYFDSSVQD